jgi:hypothetical protein
VNASNDEATLAAWAARFARRHQWALDACEEFRETLSNELRDHLPRGDEYGEAYVVAFGRTQVGKTTLILELLGVADGAEMQRVSRVLRGGRGVGQSSTATAMEYRRSVSEDWVLDYGQGPQTYSNDEAMCEALSALRKAMSARTLRATVPAIVSIPSSAFEKTRGLAGRVRILDLPGDDAADEVEREHVHRMAQAYVPHADLVLLVGRADDLRFLRPEGLALPGVEDWQVVPSRFRIVTTYSFTPASVRRYAEGLGEKASLSAFRERLLEQVLTHEIKLRAEAARPERFIPLEIGDSWADAQRQGDPLVHTVGPLLTQAKRELARDIAASATRLGRLQTALDVHITARSYREERARLWSQRMRALGDQCGQVEAEAKVARKAHAQFEAACQAITYSLEQAPRSRLEAAVEALLTGAQDNFLRLHIDKVDQLKKDTKAFLSIIAEFENGLSKWLRGTPPADTALSEFWAHIAPPLGEVAQGPLVSILREEFDMLKMRLHGYRVALYMPKFSSSYREDQAALRVAMKRASHRAAQLAAHHWHIAVTNWTENLQGELAQLQSQLAALSTVIGVKQAEAEKLQQELINEEKAWNKLASRLVADETSGNRLRELLNLHYAEELRQREREILQAATPVTSLLALLSAVDLSYFRQQIMQERNEHQSFNDPEFN